MISNYVRGIRHDVPGRGMCEYGDMLDNLSKLEQRFACDAQRVFLKTIFVRSLTWHDVGLDRYIYRRRLLRPREC